MNEGTEITEKNATPLKIEHLMGQSELSSLEENHPAIQRIDSIHKVSLLRRLFNKMLQQ